MPAYVPRRGDLVWIEFSPQSGHDQAGRRPAIVISAEQYNRGSGLAILCPVTSRSKGYPYEQALPRGLGVSGVALCDHLRSMDWVSRHIEFVDVTPPEFLAEVRAKIETLI